jgi:hypothetical protein
MEFTLFGPFSYCISGGVCFLPAEGIRSGGSTHFNGVGTCASTHDGIGRSYREQRTACGPQDCATCCCAPKAAGSSGWVRYAPCGPLCSLTYMHYQRISLNVHCVVSLPNGHSFLSSRIIPKPVLWIFIKFHIIWGFTLQLSVKWFCTWWKMEFSCTRTQGFFSLPPCPDHV